MGLLKLPLVMCGVDTGLIAKGSAMASTMTSGGGPL